MTPKIVILGSGTAGMMTALAFASKGIAVSLLEKAESTSFPNDERTTAFTQSSIRILEHFGIWDSLKDYAGEINDIYVIDNKSPKMLHLENDPEAKKGFIVPNMDIKNQLFDAITKNSKIDLIKPCNYNQPALFGDKMKISTDKEEILADLVIVCEGRNNVVSDLFELAVEKSYGQSAIVFVAEHEKDHEVQLWSIS